MSYILPKEDQIEFGNALEELVTYIEEILSSSPEENDVSAIERFLMEKHIGELNFYINKINNLELTSKDADELENKKNDFYENMQFDQVL